MIRHVMFGYLISSWALVPFWQKDGNVSEFKVHALAGWTWWAVCLSDHCLDYYCSCCLYM